MRVAVFPVRMVDAAHRPNLQGRVGNLHSFDAARSEYAVLFDGERHAIPSCNLAPVVQRGNVDSFFEIEKVLDERPGPSFLTAWRPCLMPSADIKAWKASGHNVARVVEGGAVGQLALVVWEPTWEDASVAAKEQWVVGEYNSKFTVVVKGAGRIFRLRQAPDSGLVGTSLWSAAVVFARYLDVEATSDVGPLCARRLRESRVVELGAGCGLAGMAFAAYGARVTLTDKPEVMGHCEAVWRQNFGRPGRDAAPEDAVVDGHAAAGASEVHEAEFHGHCWGDDPRADGLTPPYDIVIATDVVYRRPQLGPLIASLAALADERSTVIVAAERRDEAVWRTFAYELSPSFSVERVPWQRIMSHLHDTPEHSRRSQAEKHCIFLCRRRPPASASEQAADAAARRHVLTDVARLEPAQLDSEPPPELDAWLVGDADEAAGGEAADLLEEAAGAQDGGKAPEWERRLERLRRTCDRCARCWRGHCGARQRVVTHDD